MGSTRLPGKSMMALLPGISLIEMVIRRVMQSGEAKRTILVTSTDSNCISLCKVAEKCGCDVVRGSESDVLSRFIYAAEKYKPEAIVRICADNPFVSPVEIDKLILFFQSNDFDYASNNTYECGLPDGFGAEIIKADILKDIYDRSSDTQKEHVTQYILDNAGQFKIGYLKADHELTFPDLKLDIDTQEDFDKIKEICQQLDKNRAPYWKDKEIIAVVHKNINMPGL